MCSNQSLSTMTANHGWFPSQRGVASAQHIFEYIRKTNINSSLHDLRFGRGPVGVGGGSTLLVSTPELPSGVELGWHGDGARCVGGGCGHARGWACGEVPGS